MKISKKPSSLRMGWGGVGGVGRSSKVSFNFFFILRYIKHYTHIYLYTVLFMPNTPPPGTFGPHQTRGGCLQRCEFQHFIFPCKMQFFSFFKTISGKIGPYLGGGCLQCCYSKNSDFGLNLMGRVGRTDGWDGNQMGPLILFILRYIKH